jgi:transposase-like protein
MNETLSSQQIEIIEALAGGCSISDAAQRTGVHRNTIHNWRRTNQAFREALEDAEFERAFMLHGKCQDLANLAIQVLQDLLTDPKASASVRLRAATFLIGKALTPQPVSQPAPQPAAPVHNLHNFAQSVAPHAVSAVCTPHESGPKLHNSAQSEPQPADGSSTSQYLWAQAA